MARPRALAIHAGARVLERVRDRGLAPSDVRMVPAAAGGPKGLSLSGLDRLLFGHWLRGSAHELHLIGASIGAWRMAAACCADADAAFVELAERYVGMRFDSFDRSGRRRVPPPQEVSRVFGAPIDEQMQAHRAEVLAHPTRRLHVLASRGRHVMSHGGRAGAALGYLGAAASNAVHRRALGQWLERVVFSDPRAPLPIALDDFRTRHAPLVADNLSAAVRASCSIPFLFAPVHDVAHAPPGAYWDGGITDYHLHLRYDTLGGDGVVLYPHFQPQVVPGWLDKPLRARHRASAALGNVVLLVPSQAWTSGLHGAKLPDRSDFKRYAGDDAARVRAWRHAVAESARLADDWADFTSGAGGFDVRPLV